MLRRTLLIALALGLAVMIGSLLLALDSRPQVKAAIGPTRLAQGDHFSVQVELRNAGFFPIDIHADFCDQPLALAVANSKGQRIWTTMDCLMASTHVIRLKPGESRRISVNVSAGQRAGALYPSLIWPSGRYTLSGWFYDQRFPDLYFEIV